MIPFAAEWDAINSAQDHATRLEQEKMAIDLMLLEACGQGDLELLVYAMNMGGNVNATDPRNGLITPLHLSVTAENRLFWRKLLMAGGNPSLEPASPFETAFWLALRLDRVEAVEDFVLMRSPMTREAGTQATLLMEAVKTSRRHLVEIFLGHQGVAPLKHVSMMDARGNTALHYNILKREATQDDIEIGHLLVAAGASPLQMNALGETPEDFAVAEVQRLAALGGQQHDADFDADPDGPHPMGPDPKATLKSSPKPRLAPGQEPTIKPKVMPRPPGALGH